MENRIFKKKIKIELPYDAAIPLLDIYLKGIELHTRKNIYSSMFTAALFTIAKTWNYPK